MKNYTQLISLLPCSSLDDFPERCSRAKAQSLLAAWTGLWHPALIAGVGAAPVWRPAICTVSCEEEATQFRQRYIEDHYYSDDDCEDHALEEYADFDAEVFEQRWRKSCVVVPSLAETQVCAGFASAADSTGATLVSGFQSRSELLGMLSIESDVDPQLVAEFFSLAYVRLQVELMTRKLRYSSELDLDRFAEMALAAANAAVDGNQTVARQHLQAGFDQLAEERNQYYPVDAELLDLVLLSESLQPSSIQTELADPAPKSFVLSGATLQAIGETSAATIESFRQRIDDESLAFVAGPQHELPEDLLSLETSRRQLRQSVESFESVLGESPKVFMRRRAGLHASLPGILASCGFQAAIHATLDQGELPEPSETGQRWGGSDGSELMVIGQAPLDAASDKSFLDLGQRIGHDLDAAHVSTLMFARWPTQTCDGFEDLRNSVRYGKVLGDFTQVHTWLENAYDPGYGDVWEADEYIGPWFRQAVESGATRPISTLIRYWKLYYRLCAARNRQSILALRGGEVDRGTSAAIARVQDRIEQQTQTWSSEDDATIEAWMADIETSLSNKSAAVFTNTVPWRDRAWLTFPVQGGELPLSGSDSLVKLVTQNESRCDALTELSGFGQLLSHPVATLEQTANRRLSEQPADDAESILRNELFEVRVDPGSGGIKGVYFYGKRGNLLSQTIGVRRLDPRTRSASYGKMVCDSFELVRHSNLASSTRAEGRVLGEDGKPLARYRQQISLQRGRNVIDIEITIADITELELSRENYVVNRMAWSDEAAELFCDMQGTRQAVRRPQVEAPHFVEVVSEDHRFALLTHGIPWHRRCSKKQLDSILIAGREQQQSFRLGIAIDVESAMQTAIAEMHPKQVFDLPASGEAVKDSSSWLLHLANRNLVISSTEVLFNEDGSAAGLRLCLQETEGQFGTLKLYVCRDIESAAKQSLDGEHLHDITCRHESSQESPSYSVMETGFGAAECFLVQLHWR